MTSSDVAARGRAALLDRLRGNVAEAHEVHGAASAVRIRTHSGRSVHIRVSTKTAGTWQSNKSLRDALANRDTSRLWAFVSVSAVGKAKQPTVFLAYEGDVFRDIDRDVQEWFKRSGHIDASLKSSGHAAISEARVSRLVQPFDELVA